jgi:predicted dehydrogenase
MLKIAVISGWHVHAYGYAEEFESHPETTLTAMWDEDPVRGRDFANKFGMDFVADLDVLLARDDIDAVCINAPTNMHRDIIVKAANVGKHIFTEKVLALTMVECADIKSAIEKNNVKFCISFPHRTMPHNLYAKKVVDEKLLGDITLMRVRNAHNGSSAGWLPPHFYDPVQCGGGAMIDLGAHPMYLIPWIMGRPTEVSSAFTAVTGHEVEDNAVSIFKFSNGAIAISETGFVSEASPFALELYGTKGTLLIGHNGIQLKTADGWLTPDSLPKALPQAIPQFINGILRNETIHFGLDDAIALTEIMEKAYISHREGKHTAF